MINEALLKLATPDLAALASALESGRLPTPITAITLQCYVAKESCLDIAVSLQALADIGLSMKQIGTMLHFTLRDRLYRGQVDDQLDLVTTGPEVNGVVNRDTGVVVRELFANAEESVFVAGYSVYQGQRVFRALAERMQEKPNLHVRLFLDVQRKLGDTTSSPELVRKFGKRFRLKQWPEGFPLPRVFFDPRSLELSGDKRSCLHAKCVIVDSKHVFISSANFTEAAQERNIEVGVLIHSESVAEQLERFFETMQAAGLLVQLKE